MDFIVQVIIGLFMSGAVYGGIRSDLRSNRERAEMAHKVADKAHDRIDMLISKQ